MGTLYALVLTITMANGDFQDAVLGIYGSQKLCEAAASEQTSVTNCYPVETIIHSDDQSGVANF
ncbi:DUF1482 family protein [Pantoea stewartii]|uniref:DUF1482 family protein n=2 Tax=Pantoea stewartii subsp. stewartii DC283 TaxID=660596 RepID=A0ABN4Z816_PANSE|nr:DUF1482 family protein [Pantoea stewartii]ARF51021.1 hypothetical protein DSJ_17925 [Pantoea stewartii subsp. stewartii DC283]KAB0555034.1 DUF1482 family protein [Pantoea stewartii subsp. stewartii]